MAANINNTKGKRIDFSEGTSDTISLFEFKFRTKLNPDNPYIPNKQNDIISKGTCPNSLIRRSNSKTS